MAACAVVPVNRVGLVQPDGLGEVLNGLLVFEKSVPDQPASVVARREVCIRFEHLVKVLESHR